MINRNVYNGSRKMEEEDSHFMSETEIMEAVLSLRMKNSEGYDRIPLRVIIDDIMVLLAPFSYLFHSIYLHNEIPEQWLIAKVIPIHKKEERTDIANYRPIAKLCSASKISSLHWSFDCFLCRFSMSTTGKVKTTCCENTGNYMHFSTLL